MLGSGGGVLSNKYLFSAQKIAQVQVRDGTGFPHLEPCKYGRFSINEEEARRGGGGEGWRRGGWSWGATDPENCLTTAVPLYQLTEALQLSSPHLLFTRNQENIQMVEWKSFCRSRHNSFCYRQN